jgi:hypothetical protein
MAVRCMKHLFIWVISLICVCCATPETVGIARRVARSCNETNLDDRFFRSVFAASNEGNEANVLGVSTLLANLGEPSMSCGVETDEAYRLTFMPERGDAFTIRVERVGNTVTLTISYATEGGVPKTNRQTVTPQAWEKLIGSIAEYDFWSRSPYPSPSTMNRGVVVFHGPAWLLEGQKKGSYHAVSRVSSFMERGFDMPARTMFEIAGLDVPTAVKASP